MVTMNINLDHFLLPFLMMSQGVAHQTAQAISDRLAQGASPEDILREWAESSRGTPQGVGLQHLYQAVVRMRQTRWDQALAELGESRRKLPEIAAFIRFAEAILLTQQQDYDPAFEAYRESVAEVRSQLEIMKTFLPQAEEPERELYQRWAQPAIGQSLEGLLSGQSKTLGSGLKKLSEVFIEARTAGQESGIWELVDMIAQATPKEGQPQMDVFRTAARIITDPQAGPEWIDDLALVYTTGPGPAAGTPAAQVAESLADLTWPDPDFADDLEAIQASQPMLEEPRWPE